MIGILGSVLLGSALTFQIAIPPSLAGQSGSFIQDLPAKQSLVYVVQDGDNLTDLAKKFYMSEDNWTVLWNDNSWIVDPTNIEVGQKLAIRMSLPDQPEALLPELAKRFDGSLMPTLPVAPDYTYSAAQGVGISQAPVQATPVAQAAPSSYDAVYQAAAAKYGVPWGIIKGLHAVESGYRDGPICNAQGSGACGPFQFMSGTWAAYHDPDHPNQNSAVDGAYAAARYVAAHGNNISALYQYGTNVDGALAVARSTGSSY